MLKSKIALSIFLFVSFFAQAQHVENVRIEIKSNSLFIHYEMPDLNARYVVDVKVWYSLDGEERKPLEKVRGHVGWGVRGGKQAYRIICDDKDIAMSGAQFSITADLIRMEPDFALINKRKFYFGYNGSFGLEKQSLGFRAGYFNNIGGYGAFSIDPKDPGVGTIIGGVTYRLFATEDESVHGYSGFGIGDFFDEVTIETGVVASILGVTIAIGSNLELGVFEHNFVLGIGFMF